MIARRCHVVAAKTGEECTNPAVVTVTSGCVHEHMQTGMVCDIHREKILNRRSNCGPCSDGPAPHRCPLAGRQEPRVLSNREIAALNATRAINTNREGT